MSCYEFQVVPAPVKVRKLTGLTKDQDKFCATVTDVLTDMGLEGWEFVGAETLPHYRRRFLIFSRYEDKKCLVFRRKIERLVEPKRVNRPTAEVTTLLDPEPVREARPEAVAQFRSGARRVNVSAPQQPESDDHAPQSPPHPDDNMDNGFVPETPGRSTEQKAALSALERAVAMDTKAARHA